MITRFRVETEEESKEDAIDAAALASTRIISAIRQRGEQEGEWECTQDVVIRNGQNYKARMVMLFHPKEVNDGRL